jgi:hypothetical protein
MRSAMQTRKPRGRVATWLIAVALGACAATPVAAPASVLTGSAPTPAAAATAIPLATTGAPTQTTLLCGIYSEYASGHIVAPSTYELLSPTGVAIVLFTGTGTLGTKNQPEFGTYICARFSPGGPANIQIVSLVRPGEPGYVPPP